jgi:MerR family Zn(II)-responsive transcriptional regulator of zntA
MLVNELSKETGVSAHTIRYYEKLGLIRGKLKEDVESNNYLHYDEETLDKLELIRDAKSIGFTLKEIKKLVDAWYDEKFSQADKIKILDEKLVSIDLKIKQLREMKKLVAAFKQRVLENNC